MKTKILRHFSLSFFAALALSACGGSDKASETKPTADAPKNEATPTTKLTGEVNVYNWVEYIPENRIAAFQASTGLKVNYDTYDTDETLNTKIIAGSTGYDVVVPGADWAQGQITQGKYLKLDKSKIPNLKNLDPAIMAQVSKLDPNSEHLVPWAWGYTGIGINETKVKKALGDMPMPENPFDLVFKPEYSNKLKSCGMFMLDSPSEILLIALQYLGKPSASENPADYAEALEKLLKPIRSNIKKFGDSSAVNEISDGAYCVMLTWSGDVNMARNRAKNPDIHMLAGHGGLIFFDTMAIPADAKNLDNAYAWINYSLEPKEAALITNELGYTSPNAAAKEFIKPELVQDKTIFLPDDVLKSMEPRRLPAQPAARKAMVSAFRDFKTNK